MNDNSNQYVINPKKVNKRRKAIKILLAFFFILILGAGIAVYSIYNLIFSDNSRSLFINPNKVDIINNDSEPSSLASDNLTSPDASAQIIKYKGKTYIKNTNIVNLLFLGIDYTQERESLSLGERSDMMLVCAIDTATHKVTLISIPRDTKAMITHLDNNGKVTDSDYNKINTAYHYGSNYAAENAMACIQTFFQKENVKGTDLQIPIYLYASIDIDGIGPVADSVGGVDVTLTYDLPSIGKKGDKVHLTGDKAEFFIRDRHNDPEGDIGRASKEQTFMMLLAKKVKNNGMINNIINYYTSLQKYVKTNLTTTQMLDFAKLLKNVDVDSIETCTIPGQSQNSGQYYYIPDDDATMQLLLKVYYKEAS